MAAVDDEWRLPLKIVEKYFHGDPIVKFSKSHGQNFGVQIRS